MIYKHMDYNEVNFKEWKKCTTALTNKECDDISRACNEILDKHNDFIIDDVLPENWEGSVFYPLFEKVAGTDIDHATYLAGIMLLHVALKRPDMWVFSWLDIGEDMTQLQVERVIEVEPK